MIHLQSVANEIRDRLFEHPGVRRVGIEFLWAAVTPAGLTVRVRHRNRVLTVERQGQWEQRRADDLASEIASELIAEALATTRPATPPFRWRWMEPAQQATPGRARVPDPLAGSVPDHRAPVHRRVRPLDLYPDEVPLEEARRATLDFSQASKDLKPR